MIVRRTLVIAAALGLALIPSAASASTGWVIQPTVDPGGTGALAFNVLEAVSCSSATSCTAVGTYFDDNSTMSATLAEYWNGTSWQAQPTPTPATIPDYLNYVELRGVKCVSENACMAVGQYITPAGVRQTLAEYWNGCAWSIVPTVNPTGASASQMNAVACTATVNCIAVGYYQNSSGTNLPLAERWNGTSWTLQPIPATSGGRLRGVSCTSASACTAVGFVGTNALADRWNGSSWKAQTVPKPTGAKEIQLNDIKCTSGTICTAVGFSSPGTGENTLAERWNGTSWKVQSTPEPSGGPGSYTLTGVSCTSASACTAIGDYGNTLVLENTLAEVWNGTAWKVQSTPNAEIGGFNELLGVSCATGSTCTAVGDSQGDSGSAPVRTVAMQKT